MVALVQRHFIHARHHESFRRWAELRLGLLARCEGVVAARMLQPRHEEDPFHTIVLLRNRHCADRCVGSAGLTLECAKLPKLPDGCHMRPSATRVVSPTKALWAEDGLEHLFASSRRRRYGTNDDTAAAFA